MTPIEYLESLIAGMKMGSEIPVQLSELQLLLKMMQEWDAEPCIQCGE
jgi:hypothetical protein